MKRRDPAAAIRAGVMRQIVGEARADTKRVAKAATVAAVAPIAEAAKPTGKMRITDGVLSAAKGMRPAAVRRAASIDEIAQVYRPYQPLKGVVPQSGKLAMDEALTATASFQVLAQWGGGWGGDGLSGAFSEGLGFLGYSYLAELTQRPEYRRMSERIATEMTREWIELQITSADTVEGPDNGPDEDEETPEEPSAPGVPAEEDSQDEDGSTPQDVRASIEKVAANAKTKQLKELEDELKRLKVKDAFYNAAEQDGWFGRSHIFLEIGGEMAISDDIEQATSIGNGNDIVSRSKIGTAGGEEGSAAPKRGKKTSAVSRKLTAVRNIEPMWVYPSAYESTDPRKPGFYNPSTWYVNGRNTHATRLLTFVGRELPDILKPAYAFGGLALSQMAKPYVDNWLRTRQAVADLIESFSVSGVYTNMQGTLEDGGLEAIKRIELFNITRSNAGAYMLDKETEEFFNVSTPLGTLDDLQAQSQEQMSSVSGIPLVILLGITPKGLNASSEGEIRAFYDWIHAYQESLFRDHLQTVIELVQLSLWGKIDPEITFVFKPLWSMTAKEEADVDKIEAEADQVRIDSGVLHPEEVRKAVAAKPGSRYADINVEDVPEPPPDPTEGGDDPFGNGGGDDEGGGGDGGEADGGFGAQDEAIMLAALGADGWNESDHDRAPDGKFGSGSSGGSSSKSTSKAAGSSSKGSAGASSSLNVTKLKKSGGKLGSNEGGVYSDDAGAKFYVKKPKTKEHVSNEMAAAKLYQLAGVNTLNYRDAGPDHVATEWQQLDKNNISKFSAAEKQAAANDFAVHAWLSNWDAAGLGGDNQGILGGKPTTLDVGGSLRFRAQGGPKGAAFGDKVTELDTLRDKSMNPDAAGLFGSMSDADIKSSIERVTSIPDDKIRSAVGDDSALADRLIARKNDMGKKFGVIAQDELDDRDAEMMFMALDAALDSSIEEIADDVFTVDAIAMDEFNESKVKRDKDGQFATTGAGGAGAEAAPAKTFGTKKEHIAHLLSGGVTPKELMTAMGWPSVSMPAQAKSLGMKLEKKDGKYFGTKMTPEELKAAKETDQDKATQKALSKTPAPETLPGSSSGQKKQDLGSMAGQPAPKLGTTPDDGPPITEAQHQAYSVFMDSLLPKIHAKDKPGLKKLFADNPEQAKMFEKYATPAGKAAYAKIVGGEEAPKATPDELKKAKKSTMLPISSSDPDAAAAIVAFNNQYAGKDNLTEAQLNQKVADHKALMAVVKAKESDAQKAASAKAEEAKAKAVEAAKAAAAKAEADKAQMKAKLAEQHKEVRKELGIKDAAEIEAFDAFIDHFGGTESALTKFKSWQKQAQNEAKNNPGHGYEKLSGFEMGCIKAYTGPQSGWINNAIRDDTMTPAQYMFEKVLNQAIDKLPKKTGEVRRGLTLDASMLAKMQPGKVWTHRNFASSNAEGWGGNTKLVISASGKGGAYVAPISSHKHENETLFKSNLRLFIDKVEDVGGVKHVYCREL